MKAFIAAHTFRSREKDILILAKTKKDAMSEFKQIKELEFGYKSKDII